MSEDTCIPGGPRASVDRPLGNKDGTSITEQCNLQPRGGPIRYKSSSATSSSGLANSIHEILPTLCSKCNTNLLGYQQAKRCISLVFTRRQEFMKDSATTDPTQEEFRLVALRSRLPNHSISPASYPWIHGNCKSSLVAAVVQQFTYESSGRATANSTRRQVRR